MAVLAGRRAVWQARRRVADAEAQIALRLVALGEAADAAQRSDLLRDAAKLYWYLANNVVVAHGLTAATPARAVATFLYSLGAAEWSRAQGDLKNKGRKRSEWKLLEEALGGALDQLAGLPAVESDHAGQVVGLVCAQAHRLLSLWAPALRDEVLAAVLCVYRRAGDELL